MLELKCVSSENANSIYQNYADEMLDAPSGEEKTPAQFLQHLIDREDYHQAIRFLAHALPPIKAVEWVCHCIRQVLEDIHPDQEQCTKTYQPESENLSASLKDQFHILTATEQFVRDRTDQNRRHAMTLAQSYGLEYSVSWCAMAAYWSEGSLAPKEEPDIAPPPYLYTHGVIAALTLAATQPDNHAQDPSKALYLFIKKAILLANK